MRTLSRKELQQTYLDPEIHRDLTIVAATERKPIREALEGMIEKYIIDNGFKPIVDAARKQSVPQQ